MRTVTAGSWLIISEGCELRYAMHGSNAAYVTVGESGVDHEFTFDYTRFRELVVQGERVLAEMEGKAAEEEALAEFETVPSAAPSSAAEARP